ncbi:type II toxin-antitoxin system HipA family toxin [Roseospirillum parvum]|uniref:Serine/threonine-protein kinase HipA n=1 Tax=Roseospirillum parvum TaxID=83401 RepID=A0A1G8F1Z5_9PROT|nr:type II toxin-antitoxin system HipA family toxin [Roseospirillum parvum]SDH76165.1 serine/threonine-protein kinase HipA [Roseospirillum parvum]
MPRRRTRIPLNVYLNNRLVGRLNRESSGAIDFAYDLSWLEWEHALPVSLSLPLREDRYIGAPVAAVFENLLPDSDALRKRVAERVGATGTDAYSLLAAIGRDCVGALQFLPDTLSPDDIMQSTGKIEGEPVDEDDIGRILNNLARAPLGLDEDDAFRISVAGAQEKTALLHYEGRWLKPIGTTPTTHIFKPQIGQLPNGIDLSNSVENEFYCLQLMKAFGLPVNEARIESFAGKKVLVIERFDRRWARDGRLLRLPQEDCCQALSVPPTMKYQNQGGPGISAIVELLKGSDEPEADQLAFFKAQIIFWLIGATDGHAKNFSIFLTPGSRYRLTPFYDVLTAQPSLDDHQIQRKQMKLAMAIGDKNRYRIEDIMGRHFVQTGAKAGMAKRLTIQAICDISEAAENALKAVEAQLPKDFPAAIHESVSTAMRDRARRLELSAADAE